IVRSGIPVVRESRGTYSPFLYPMIDRGFVFSGVGLFRRAGSHGRPWADTTTDQVWSLRGPAGRVQSISRLTHTALASAVYASREALPLPCKTCFRLAGCAFSGRVSNPLDHYRRFLVTFPSSFSGLCLTLA